MSDKIKQYRTDNLALCPFLEMNGLKYLCSEPGFGKNDRPVVWFIFNDPRGLGKDLELEFVRSDVKRYRDLFMFFRGEIEKMKRKVERINFEQSRKGDVKFNGEDDE